ncbi:hypothetical protein KQX54_011480 [Cotesia glomerata]|uniref:Uncharacterized protein n=1 Tax=Cotesia glomerata TaxID=32391 RepID=A0AAV7IGU9_COTGL|nr:hypothetical protein KQX54_011480 [Cotesia glomerata]
MKKIEMELYRLRKGMGTLRDQTAALNTTIQSWMRMNAVNNQQAQVTQQHTIPTRQPFITMPSHLQNLPDAMYLHPPPLQTQHHAIPPYQPAPTIVSTQKNVPASYLPPQPFKNVNNSTDIQFNRNINYYPPPPSPAFLKN